MSGGMPERADATVGRRRVLAGSLFSSVVVTAAAVAAWPVYRSVSFLVLVGVAVGVAAAIAVVAHRRAWSGWVCAGVLAGAFLVVGVPIAVPSRLGGPIEVLRGLGELWIGAVVAWKDLVTVDLPVGAYRNLLVPALVVFLVGTCALLLLSWRAGPRAYLAIPVALAMVSFGLLFGRPEVSAPLEIGPLVLPAPIETALGVTGLLSSLLWLSWRSHDERVRALRRAAATSGVRVSRHATPADRRREGLGIGMVAAAAAVAVAIVPFAAQGVERDVLRTAVGPEIDLSDELSPLSQYRSHFADDRAGDVMFTVSTSGDLPERVRIATLSEYDGEAFRVGGPTGEELFVRVPSARDAADGIPYDLQITMGAWEGVWMPTAGDLADVSFVGGRAASLADGFYYNAGAAAGVETAGGGLAAGETFRMTGTEAETPALETLVAPGTAPELAAPESLRTWLTEHGAGTDGAALADVVALLRERGYLSHAVSVGDDGAAPWMTDLEGYRFQPSASGHSLGRIDQLFSRLLEREGDPRAEASGNYVAAIGDDEQFAVATALIARELGFPSRVVVGVRLSSDDPSLPVCEEGRCLAQDLSAWTEVLSSDGSWVAVDVTPQHLRSPSLEVTQQRDPEVVTDVHPELVEEVVPPEPLQQDTVTSEPVEEPAGLDLSWLGPTLRTTAIVLLALLLVAGPFLAIAAVKARRRRTRRTRGSPADRIAAGWEELVDAAVDVGRLPPATATRSEAAAALGVASAADLAARADRAVFAAGVAAPDPDDADAYWREVDEGRLRILRGRGFWRGVGATVSLRSIVRPLAPAPGARPLFAERGRRPAVRPVRQTS